MVVTVALCAADTRSTVNAELGVSTLEELASLSIESIHRALPSSKFSAIIMYCF